MMRTTNVVEEFSVEDILKSVDKSSSEYLEGKTLQKITEEVFETIQKIDEENAQQLCKRLEGYRKVNAIYELHKGKYVKGIQKDPDTGEIVNPQLLTLGILSNIHFFDNGVVLSCILYKRLYRYKYDNYVLFQNLTNDEMVVLSAFDYLQRV